MMRKGNEIKVIVLKINIQYIFGLFWIKIKTYLIRHIFLGFLFWKSYKNKIK
jgi:hypothetical protein